MRSDEGGGGGTTTPLGGACWINPADLQGQIDPILDRLSKLEELVAKLGLTNVEANQLSDISPATGWITDYTFAGVGGWTLTQAGTLIPPPGLSLASLGWDIYGDGSHSEAVVMNPDGTFTILAGTDANGEPIETTSSSQVAVYQATGYIASIPSTGIYLTWTTIKNRGFVNNQGSRVVITKSGWYEISLKVPMVYRPSSTALTSVTINFGNITIGGVVTLDNAQRMSFYWPTSTATTAQFASFGSFTAEFEAGMHVAAVALKSSASPTVTLGSGTQLYIKKL